MVINSLSLDQVQAKRDALQNLLESVYQNAPRTIEQAYRLAQKALKVDEQMTFSNEEINNFLPNTLRINS
jgi:hypothetical protein